jgi:hypothetical protein
MNKTKQTIKQVKLMIKERTILFTGRWHILHYLISLQTNQILPDGSCLAVDIDRGGEGGASTYCIKQRHAEVLIRPTQWKKFNR